MFFASSLGAWFLPKETTKFLWAPPIQTAPLFTVGVSLMDGTPGAGYSETFCGKIFFWNYVPSSSHLCGEVSVENVTPKGSVKVRVADYYG